MTPAALPTPPVPRRTDGGQPPHVTGRLLTEAIAPGQHLVFNPLSGAVDRMDDADLARLGALQAGHPASLSPAEERDLRARAYLFDTPAEEEALLERSVAAAWARMRALQPATYTVCPTLACNLACGYCFEGDSLTDKPQGVMSDAQVSLVFEAIAALRAGTEPEGDTPAYAPWVALFGGEPLLPSTRRCVARVLREASDRGFLVGATTNGVNLVRYGDLLSEYADILTTFQVTLDGPKAVHDSRRHRLGGQGTFDEICRGVDLLLSLGIDVDLRVNVDGANLPTLPELVAFLDGRGWTDRDGFRLALAPVTDHQPAGGCGSKNGQVLSEMEMARRVMALTEAFPRLGEVCHLGFLRHLDYLVGVLEPEKRGRRERKVGPRYWYCEASTDKQYVFTPDGLVYSCTEAVGKARHAIGRFDPALEMWRAETARWQGRTILSHPKCRACSISTLCGGGCNFAAREQDAAKDGPPHKDGLLQITVGGRRGAEDTRAETTVTQVETTVTQAEPFCNAAEETVRAYLRHVGQRLTAPSPT